MGLFDGLLNWAKQKVGQVESDLGFNHPAPQAPAPQQPTPLAPHPQQGQQPSFVAAPPQLMGPNQQPISFTPPKPPAPAAPPTPAPPQPNQAPNHNLTLTGAEQWLKGIAQAAPKFVEDSVIKPVTNTVAGTVVEPARSVVAQATENRPAYLAAEQRGNEDIQNSLPVGMAKGVYNFGKAGYYAPSAIRNTITGGEVSTNPVINTVLNPYQAAYQALGGKTMPLSPQDNDNIAKGLTALNKSYQGGALTLPEKLIANHIPGASQAAQNAGFDPNQSAGAAVAKTAVGIGQSLAPFYGAEYGDPLGVFHGLEGASKAVDVVRNLPVQMKTTALKGATADAPTVTVPTKSLTSYEGAPDATRVDQYKQAIQNGQPIDPIIAMKDSSGHLGIEDGKHRFEAYKQLGIDNVPIKVVTPDALHAVLQGGYIGKDEPIVPRDNPLPRSERQGLALDHPNFNEGAFGAEDRANLEKQIKIADEKRANLSTPNEPIKLTREERKSLIENNPYQETKNKVNLGMQEGNIKGAIAQAMGVSTERDTRLAEAQQLVKKLSDNDKELLYRYDNGEKISNLAKEADNPKAFTRAATKTQDAFDYHLAADRSAGGVTLRQNQYLPHYYEATPEMMQKLGVPEDQWYKVGNEYKGFHDTSAKYPSYLEAAKVGLKPLFGSVDEAIGKYHDNGTVALRNALLRKTLEQVAPDHVGDLNTVSGPEGIRFRQAAGNLPFAVSDELNKYLGNFQKRWEPKTTAGKIALKSAELANRGSKAALFMASPVHYANVLSNFLGLTVGTGHGIIAGKGLGEALASSVSKEGYGAIVEHYRQTGTLDYARNMGMNLEGRGRMGRFTNAIGMTLADAARKAGVDVTSKEGTALGAEYNKVIGHKNYQVEGTSPNSIRLARGGTLAPNWTPSQLGLVKDAVTKTLTGDAKHGIGLYNAGDVARGSVIGKRAVEAGVAIIASAIASGKMPTWQKVINEAGLNPNNPIPNIEGNSTNKKGEKQVINLPTDQLGLAAGLVTDPAHFLQSRYSPGLATVTRAVTNQDWNGNQIADKNMPGWQLKLAKGALKGNLPISVQNATNPNLSIKQGLLQDVGFRYKTDPNDPQVVATKQHFDQQKTLEDLYKSGKLSQIDPSFQDVSPQKGTEMYNNEYGKLHIPSSQDENGNNIPKDWNALSSQQKASFYLSNDPVTGTQRLSPSFYIDKKLALAQPDRPHDPIFDLDNGPTQGVGVGFKIDPSGNIIGTTTIPKAQIALDYASQNASSDQKALILDANPWLKDYEKQVANDGANYQQNMDMYFKQQGWTDQAIGDYWAKHPSTTPPITPPNPSPQTQSLMDQYSNITDPTQKAQFFTDNAAELAQAFKQNEQYKNLKAVAQGALPLQTHPDPTPEVAALLTQLQKNPNHDKAISKANALLIQNNPSLNQYLADSGLFNTAKDLARYQFQDPAHPGLNQGQLLNLGRPIDQSTLSGITNLGKYDIGKNPTTGQFSFMQNGGFAPGTSAGGGSGGSGKGGYSKKKKNPRIIKKHVKINRRRTHIKFHSTPHINVKVPSGKGRLKITPKKVSPITIG